MPILEFRDVSKVLRSGFARRPLYRLGPLSLAVEAGEIFGYLGPNGAGKTTSIKIAMGIIRADSGEVRFFDRSARATALRTGIGFLPEHPYFYHHLTAMELLDFYGQLFGIPSHTRRRRAGELLEATGLGPHGGTRLSKFSKGMLQRVGLAQALINDPEIVMLDEPLSGLDPSGRRQIRDLITGLKSNGKTVFFSSHILQDVEMMCDRVGILQGGKLLKAATMQDILSETLSSVEITVCGLAAAELRAMFGTGVEEKGGRTLIRLQAGRDPDGAIAAVLAAGGRVAAVVPQRQTLEDYFMRNLEARGQGARRPGGRGEEAPVESLAAPRAGRDGLKIGIGS